MGRNTKLGGSSSLDQDKWMNVCCALVKQLSAFGIYRFHYLWVLNQPSTLPKNVNCLYTVLEGFLSPGKAVCRCAQPLQVSESFLDLTRAQVHVVVVQHPQIMESVDAKLTDNTGPPIYS